VLPVQPNPWAPLEEGIVAEGGSDGSTIRDNLIAGNQGGGIILNGSGGDNIQGNTITSDGIGVYISLPDEGFGSGNTVQGNTITFNSGGLVLGSGNVVQGNTITSNGGIGVSIEGSNNIIGGAAAGAGNTIAFNNGPGVWVTDDPFGALDPFGPLPP